MILANVASRDDGHSVPGAVRGAVARPPPLPPILLHESAHDEKTSWTELCFDTPQESDALIRWLRSALFVAVAVWGIVLAAADYRTGVLGGSFIHGPLLVFHEAGHFVFRLFGEWVMVLGGTLGQLVMPAVMLVALLCKTCDPFGAAVAFWLFGVSLLDIAPYVYDGPYP